MFLFMYVSLRNFQSNHWEIRHSPHFYLPNIMLVEACPSWLHHSLTRSKTSTLRKLASSLKGLFVSCTEVPGQAESTSYQEVQKHLLVELAGGWWGSGLGCVWFLPRIRLPYQNFGKPICWLSYSLPKSWPTLAKKWTRVGSGALACQKVGYYPNKNQSFVSWPK
jgi:hypothetical protein